MTPHGSSCLGCQSVLTCLAGAHVVAPALVPPAWPCSCSRISARAPVRSAEAEKAACFKRGHCARARLKMPACKKAAAAFEKCGFISARPFKTKQPRGHKNKAALSTKKPRSAPSFIARVQQSRSDRDKPKAHVFESRRGFVARAQ